MKLYDQHVHSRHSFDSVAQPDDIVRRACDRGLAGVTFTEHYDTHPEEAPGCVYDDAAYSDAIEQVRDTFGQSIWIGKGIEVDFQRDNAPAIIDFLGRHSFDVVLLSVHWACGEPIHARYVWEGRDPRQLTRRYLESVLEAVRFCEELHRSERRVFDVLAHLDFVKRYSLRFAGSNHMSCHGDLVDEILRTCLAADIIPEINTSTLRGGLDEPMPGPAIVQRYADLGGTMMTVGSDSHTSQHVGAGLDAALDILRAADISNLAVFDGRDRRAEPIEAP